MKIRLSLHQTASFSYYFWLECGEKQLALGPEQDLLRVRMGLEWVVELLCSLFNRNVASFSTAQARPGAGGGRYPVGDEGLPPPSLGEARST